MCLGKNGSYRGQSAGKNKMKETDLAWLAGIWEGEGSVLLYSRPVNNKRIQITPSLSMGNTDIHIVNRAREIINEMGANFNFQERFPKKGTRKFYLLVSTHFKNIKIFLENVLPFMIGGKKAYGETLLAFVTRRYEKSLTYPGGLKHLPYDEEDYEFVRSSETIRETPTGEDIVQTR